MKREKAAAEVCSPKVLIDAGSGTYEHEARVTSVIQSSNLLPQGKCIEDVQGPKHYFANKIAMHHYKSVLAHS